MTLTYRSMDIRPSAPGIAAVPLRSAMRVIKDYRLTAAFLVISAIVFFSATHVIATIAGRSAESNTVGMIQRQSERDALIFARLVSRAISGDVTDAAAADAGRIASEMLDSSDVLRLSLHDQSGQGIWSSGRSDWGMAEGEQRALTTAMQGETNTVLLKDVSLSSGQDDAAVVESFVPLFDSETDSAVMVLAIARNVSEPLAAQIALTRSQLYKSILTTMAAGFGILLVLVATIDVTLKRSREREMSQGMAMARMDIVNQELEKANRERNRFVAMISHELKTPLTSIMAFSELLGKRLRKHDELLKENEFAGVIKRNSTNLERLITDLLDASKLQAGQLTVESSDFAAAGTFEEAAATVQPILNARHQELVQDIHLEDIQLRADRGRLQQVVTNLITNASKYTPEGSTVKLTAYMTGNVLSVSIKDNGPGIPKDKQADLFRPFVRVDNEATRSQSGTGLGLAIVKAIVEGHNGVVELNSEIGFGTEVRFRMPVGVAAQPAGSMTLEAELDQAEEMPATPVSDPEQVTA